jgi:hypothetical protein
MADYTSPPSLSCSQPIFAARDVVEAADGRGGGVPASGGAAAGVRGIVHRARAGGGNDRWGFEGAETSLYGMSLKKRDDLPPRSR